MIRSFPAVLILLVSLSCRGQFNDSIHYHFNLASTGVINKTNDGSSHVFSNLLGFSAKTKKVLYNSNFSWIYGKQDSLLTNNDFSGHGDVNIGKDVHKLYYWGLFNYDHSYSLKINHRFQAGAGIAYDFIDSPAAKVSISDVILYEQGDLTQANLSHFIYQIARNSFSFQYHWSIKDRVTIDGMHFYQQSLSDMDDYIIQSTNTLSVKLKKWLSVMGSVVYNQVSRTKRQNLIITYGVNVDKYF